MEADSLDPERDARGKAAYEALVAKIKAMPREELEQACILYMMENDQEHGGGSELEASDYYFGVVRALNPLMPPANDVLRYTADDSASLNESITAALTDFFKPPAQT